MTAIYQSFRKAGFSHRIVGVQVVRELDETLAMLLERGLLSESLYAEYAGSLRFAPPAGVGDVRSLVVVATPSPPVKVSFHLSAGRVETVIPPTYISSAVRARCQELLCGIVGPAGFSAARVPVPVKLLAVRTGLAEYGRNNIAYVHGSGSLVRLDAFATDADLIPAGERRGGLSRFIVGGRDPVSGHWNPARRMGGCAACKACHHACPTGCIPHPEEGVMIDAKRCLTYLNEHEGEWPDWLDAASHECLVGCMKCQRVCPANKYHFRRESRVAEFDRAETALILQNLPSEALPAPLRAKLARLDLDGYSMVLGRNLLALAG
ncbi:MAG: 4Fe-4S double cluster binding domain-containing protein [bacterium]